MKTTLLCYNNLTLFLIKHTLLQARMPKGWINLKHLPILCNGLINHSLKHHQLTWFLPTTVQNPNLVINILYLHLYEMFSSNKVRAPVLYVQADNCYKENKNKWVMFFCALLVSWGWFEEVYMSFLPVGHTHEDIDRLFSYLRIILSCDEYNTLMALISKIMPRAYNTRMKPVAKIQPLEYDWKAWFTGYMPEIHGHSGPHTFHFQKQSTQSDVCAHLQ
jgi:hypothetical protein